MTYVKLDIVSSVEITLIAHLWLKGREFINIFGGFYGKISDRITGKEAHHKNHNRPSKMKERI